MGPGACRPPTHRASGYQGSFWDAHDPYAANELELSIGWPTSGVPLALNDGSDDREQDECDDEDDVDDEDGANAEPSLLGVTANDRQRPRR